MFFFFSETTNVIPTVAFCIYKLPLLGCVLSRWTWSEVAVNNSPVKSSRQVPFGEANANTELKYIGWLLWAPLTRGTAASSPRKSKFESWGYCFCKKKKIFAPVFGGKILNSFPTFQSALGSAYFGADYLKWTPTLFLKKEKVFIAPFKAPILKLLHMEKEAGERERHTHTRVRETEREREGQKYKTQGNQDHAVQNCYSCFCFYWLFLLASLFQQLRFI